MENIKLSLFEQFLLNGDLSNDEKYNDLLERVGIKNATSLQILKDKCETIGNAGWVVCPFWKMNVNKNETMLDTWLNLIKANRGDTIADYFSESNFSLLKEIISRMRFELKERQREWFNEAATNFFERRYLSCNLILTVLLERIIRNMPASVWQRNVSKYFESTVKNDIEKINEDNRKDRLNIFYEKYFYVITLEKFISNYYALKGYPFEKGAEPELLVRDWLVHGMTNKDITEIECIKLFNAISTTMFLINNLKREQM